MTQAELVSWAQGVLAVEVSSALNDVAGAVLDLVQNAADASAKAEAAEAKLAVVVQDRDALLDGVAGQENDLAMALIRERKKVEAKLAEARKSCDGSCDIALARRQVGPDGFVPGNAKECAHAWKREAVRLEAKLSEVEREREEARMRETLSASRERVRRTLEAYPPRHAAGHAAGCPAVADDVIAGVCTCDLATLREKVRRVVEARGRYKDTRWDFNLSFSTREAVAHALDAALEDLAREGT
jgi:hypothetical protein